MSAYTDDTHDPSRQTWVESARIAGTDFPIQNLPYGVFSRRGTGEPARIGVAIGDRVLDVRGCIEEQILPDLPPETACALCAESLNDLLAQGRESWAAARRSIGHLLDEATSTLRDDEARRAALLIPMADATMHLPARIGDYTDFYASIHHATNVGSMFRPDNPLLPNYRHLPVG
ncbi:MAG: fumarylacetoacetase, partial [Planctomycetota bacterium]